MRPFNLYAGSIKWHFNFYGSRKKSWKVILLSPVFIFMSINLFCTFPFLNCVQKIFTFNSIWHLMDGAVGWKWVLSPRGCAGPWLTNWAWSCLFCSRCVKYGPDYLAVSSPSPRKLKSGGCPGYITVTNLRYFDGSHLLVHLVFPRSQGFKVSECPAMSYKIYSPYVPQPQIFASSRGSSNFVPLVCRSGLVWVTPSGSC